MRTIYIRVSHDDDSMVTQLLRVVFIPTNTTTKSSNQGANLLRGKHFIKTRTFHVQNFTFQWKDCLELSVSALFRRTTRRLTLNKIKFRHGRISFLTVRKLPRKSRDIQSPFSPGHLSSLSSGFSCSSSIHHFARNKLCFLGLLL